jgi:hypothetical protein
MSGNDRPELRAFGELETLVRHLGEELAVFRRRALSAEAQVKGGDGNVAASRPSARGTLVPGDRLQMLEAENESLRTRLERAEDRVRQMMDRVRFLRQQLRTQSNGTPVSAGAAGGRS